jgi:hypothetical protein
VRFHWRFPSLSILVAISMIGCRVVSYRMKKVDDGGSVDGCSSSVYLIVLKVSDQSDVSLLFVNHNHFKSSAMFCSCKSVIPNLLKRLGRVTRFHGTRQCPLRISHLSRAIEIFC